jgi:hypothetical protein
MYVDEKRHGEVTADPFKRSTLIAWLERKNPTEVYCYIDTGKCLMCQYFADHGYQDLIMNSRGFDSRGNKFTPLPEHFDDIASGAMRDLTDKNHFTFGAALKRARAVQ